MSTENQENPILESEEEVVINYESLSITEIMKMSQNQNGLRHNDFSRYRKYCKRKVKRIRKAINLTFGKGKFQPKLYVFENVKDSKILEILLFMAEKNWAYAMDLKTEMKDPKNRDNRRIPFHINKRLKKAVEWAQKLETLTKKSDNKTHLEAEAYYNFLNAQFEFESESWQKSLESYVQARRIYSELLKLADSFQKILFNEKIEQIDQSLRYCNHKIKGKMDFTMEEMLELQANSDDLALKEQIEGLLEEKRKGVVEKSEEFTLDYEGNKVLVKNERVILQLQKIKESEMVLSKMKDKEAHEEVNSEEVLSCYIEIFSNYDEAIKLNTKDKQENVGVQGIEEIYQTIQDILILKKLSATLERNRIQLKQAESNFQRENVISNLLNASSKRNFKQNGCMPFDLVRYHDNIIQIINQILSFEIVGKSKSAFFKEIKSESSFLAFNKRFYIACHYFSAKLFLEFLSISYSILNTKDDQVTKFNAEKVQKLNDNLTLLSCQALYYLNNDVEAVPSQKVSKVEQNDQNKHGLSLERILREGSDLTDIPDNIHIVDFPPKLEALLPKPIFLDLAYGHLEYPNLSSKVKEEKKSILGSVMGKFGFFGGKK